MASIVLRDYQSECVEAVEAALAEGVRRQLVVLPTGGGKTIVFSEVVRRRADKPVLILAHRDELLQQAREKLVSVAPELGMQIGLVKAGSNDVGAPVVIASIQTLARKTRLAQLPAHFGTVITDEAHHAVADSYQAVYEHLDADLELFVTATPKRADGKSLEDVADRLVFAESIESMIERGYLCPPRGKRITVDVDLSKVKKSHGDFQADALADALEEAGTPAEVLAAYSEHGGGRKTIVFAATVAMAHRMAEVFRGAGYAAEAVDGTTPAEERGAMLRRFHLGETQILCNVGVLTEGFDEPSVSCIILAAPTRSEVKYTQIVGRGLRLHPGKTDCLVLDVAGASEDKSIQSLPALFGLGELLDDENVLEAIARERSEADEEAALAAASDAAARTGNQRASEAAFQAERRRRNAESIKFFNRERMNWRRVGEKWTIAFDKERTLVLWPLVDERYEVLIVTASYDRRSKQRSRAYRTLARGLDLGYAMGAAEESIRRHGKPLLADREAAWREDEVTQGQVRNLKHLKLPIPMTKGEASDMLSEANLAEDLEALEGVLVDREAREAVAA